MSVETSINFTSFAPYTDVGSYVGEMVQSLGPYIGANAEGIPKTYTSYPDIQALYDPISYVVIGVLSSRPHPILRDILPMEIGNALQRRTNVTEYLYALPVPNPHGGVNETMAKRSKVHWSFARRYGIHFKLEGDYILTPQGQYEIGVQMARQSAYLNERAATEAYRTLLRKPEHQVKWEKEEFVNAPTAVKTARNRGDWLLSLERYKNDTAAIHKDPIGLHKVRDNVAQMIEHFTQRGGSPNTAIIPREHAHMLKNGTPIRTMYDKGGQEAVDRLNQTDVINRFMGLDIYYAPSLLIDGKTLPHFARHETVHGEFAYLPLNCDRIDVYDPWIDEKRPLRKEEIEDAGFRCWNRTQMRSDNHRTDNVPNAPGMTFTIGVTRRAPGVANAPLAFDANYDSGLQLDPKFFRRNGPLWKQIFKQDPGAVAGNVNLEFHGWLLANCTYRQAYMAIPFQQAGSQLGNVYVTRPHLSRGNDVAHQELLVNVTQYIGVHINNPFLHWVKDNQIYAGVGAGASKELIMKLERYRRGVPENVDDPGLYAIPLFYVSQSSDNNLHQFLRLDSPKCTASKFSTEKYMDITGRIHMDENSEDIEYMYPLAGTFLEFSGMDKHIEKEKAQRILWRSTYDLYRNDMLVKSVSGATHHGPYERTGHREVRMDGNSVYPEAMR